MADAGAQAGGAPGQRAQAQLGDDRRDATRCAARGDRGLHADRGAEHVAWGTAVAGAPSPSAIPSSA